MSEKKPEDKPSVDKSYDQTKEPVKVELEDLEIKKPGEVKGGLASTKTSTYMCPW
jgi:hypothetical protein